MHCGRKYSKNIEAGFFYDPVALNLSSSGLNRNNSEQRAHTYTSLQYFNVLKIKF